MWYVTEAGAGRHTGESADSSWSREEFNNVTNWSDTEGNGSKIAPGDTINVGGTLAGSMKCAGSGIVDQVITIRFDPDARACFCLHITLAGQ